MLSYSTILFMTVLLIVLNLSLMLLKFRYFLVAVLTS